MTFALRPPFFLTSRSICSVAPRTRNGMLLCWVWLKPELVPVHPLGLLPRPPAQRVQGIRDAVISVRGWNVPPSNDVSVTCYPAGSKTPVPLWVAVGPPSCVPASLGGGGHATAPATKECVDAGRRHLSPCYACCRGAASGEGSLKQRPKDATAKDAKRNAGRTLGTCGISLDCPLLPLWAIKTFLVPWLVWLSGLNNGLGNERVASSIPSQGTCLG